MLLAAQRGRGARSSDDPFGDRARHRESRTTHGASSTLQNARSAACRMRTQTSCRRERWSIAAGSRSTRTEGDTAVAMFTAALRSARPLSAVRPRARSELHPRARASRRRAARSRYVGDCRRAARANGLVGERPRATRVLDRVLRRRVRHGRPRQRRRRPRAKRAMLSASRRARPIACRRAVSAPRSRVAPANRSRSAITPNPPPSCSLRSSPRSFWAMRSSFRWSSRKRFQTSRVADEARSALEHLPEVLAQVVRALDDALTDDVRVPAAGRRRRRRRCRRAAHCGEALSRSVRTSTRRSGTSGARSLPRFASIRLTADPNAQAYAEGPTRDGSGRSRGCGGRSRRRRPIRSS